MRNSQIKTEFIVACNQFFACWALGPQLQSAIFERLNPGVVVKCKIWVKRGSGRVGVFIFALR